MIVSEPPYDLVAVFADADAKLLFEQLIERAQQGRIIREIRWRSVRDTRRDAFRADPTSIIAPFRRVPGCKFLFFWDHQGSGREAVDSAVSVAEVHARLQKAGLDEDTYFAIAFDPEVEVVLLPVWDRVKEIVASIREELPPPDNVVFEHARRILRQNRQRVPATPSEALLQFPKEMLEGVVAEVQLRWSASIFQEIGRQISVRNLRTQVHARQVFDQLGAWFPA